MNKFIYSNLEKLVDSGLAFVKTKMGGIRHHDIQHKDTQQNDIQHNDIQA